MKKVIILGAAGRDFHNYNVYFRGNPDYEVVCFTAAQIPNIDGRIYPKSLTGSKDIPIVKEEDLERFLLDVDEIYFSYSDVSHEYVMHLASRVQSKGPSFVLLGPKETMLKSKKPVIAITGVRTGVGKSNITRKVAKMFDCSIVRHPMPYGEFKAVQEYKSLEDLEGLTVEEQEDYRLHILDGRTVYSGVDYEKILEKAEQKDIILWDGGNNDLPFFKPTVHIVIADALRAGHEIKYYPGEVNFRMADIIIISKSNMSSEGVQSIRKNAENLNPSAIILEAPSILKADGKPKGKVLVVEDGPTVTHGSMKYGAAYVFAKHAERLRAIDYAKGTIREIMKKYGLELVLPAVGYSEQQIKDLVLTINESDADVVVSSSPVDLKKLGVNKPVIQVSYDLDCPNLEQTINSLLNKRLDKAL